MRTIFCIAAALLGLIAAPRHADAQFAPPDLGYFTSTHYYGDLDLCVSLYLYEDGRNPKVTLWPAFVTYNWCTGEFVHLVSPSDDDPPDPEPDDYPDKPVTPTNPNPPMGPDPLPLDSNGDPIPNPTSGTEPGHDIPVFFPGTDHTTYPVFAAADGMDTVYYRYIEHDTSGEFWLAFVKSDTGSGASEFTAVIKCD